MVATPYEGLRSNPGSFAMLLATDARGLELKSGQFDVKVIQFLIFSAVVVSNAH